MNDQDIRDALDKLPKTLHRDIATAMLALGKIGTKETRDTILWVQYVLSACLELAKIVNPAK